MNSARVLDHVLAERIMLAFTGDVGRLGRFEAHIVPAKILETGRALEQIADPHALNGLDLQRLADYFAGQQMPTQEER